MSKSKDNVTLKDWLAQIETYHPHDIRLGLDRILEVGNKANLFDFKCPVVTLAGTNGKGSTLTTLARLLEGSHKNYGTYTSPHLIHFNERIRINGEIVSDDQLCDAFSQVETLSKGIPLTYFEFTTLAAMVIFQKANLDLLILEVGMGGRLDAVNAVSPDLAVLTSISYDHEAWLGQTLPDIAKEKAGILRHAIPVVLSQEACQTTVLEALEAFKTPHYIEQKDFGYDDHSEWFCWLTDSCVRVPKNYLPSNSVSLAMATYTILENGLMALPPLSHAVKNLTHVGMLGRFHSLSIDQKPVIFDVAHNPAGTKWLAQRLGASRVAGIRRAVWASLADKSLTQMIESLCQCIDVWYVADLSPVPRAASLQTLIDTLKAQGIEKIHSFDTVEKAFLEAKQEASTEDEIVVFGSFFTVAQAYQAAQLENMTRVNNGLFYS